MSSIARRVQELHPAPGLCLPAHSSSSASFVPTFPDAAYGDLRQDQALARAHAHARALDPVEIFCPPLVGLHRGMFHEQYLAAARNGIWGRAGSSCGGTCLVRQRGVIVELIPALCGTWSCPLCGPKKAAWLKREIQAAQVRYALSQFWTLTIGTSSCTAEASSAVLKHGWHLLHRRLVRAFGPFSYLWTHELTKAGYGHLHLLCSLDLAAQAPADAGVRWSAISSWLDPAKAAALGNTPAAWALAWLSQAWRECSGGSYIVDVAPVESASAGSYLAKYCTQQASLRALPGYEHLHSQRFFTKSRDVQFAPFLAPSEDGGWVPWARPYWDAVGVLRSLGGVAPIQRVQGSPRSSWVGVTLQGGRVVAPECPS